MHTKSTTHDSDMPGSWRENQRFPAKRDEERTKGESTAWTTATAPIVYGDRSNRRIVRGFGPLWLIPGDPLNTPIVSSLCPCEFSSPKYENRTLSFEFADHSETITYSGWHAILLRQSWLIWGDTSSRDQGSFLFYRYFQALRGNRVDLNQVKCVLKLFGCTAMLRNAIGCVQKHCDAIRCTQIARWNWIECIQNFRNAIERSWQYLTVLRWNLILSNFLFPFWTFKFLFSPLRFSEATTSA